MQKTGNIFEILIDRRLNLCYNYLRVINDTLCRGVVQSVERWSPKPNVEGSSPSAPVEKSKSNDLDFFVICAPWAHELQRKPYLNGVKR